MKIIIAGAGAVGSHLAALLTHENHDIVLIDPDENKLANASEGLDLMTLSVAPTSIRKPAPRRPTSSSPSRHPRRATSPAACWPTA